MRLLRRVSSDEFTFEHNDSEGTPPYAILSHTWGSDAEEVTLDDVKGGTGKNKPGFDKVRFCSKQARTDGLHHFWIDTCCIDKTDQAELSHSIQSMFRWYRQAAQCYVYLSDVSTPCAQGQGEVDASSWESAFHKSYWFTRGWTLQELLAPDLVEFFSREGMKLGDKMSLKHQIHRVTGIPKKVLEGAALSEFSVNEKLLWREGRRTKKEEDGAYSLLGIFDVYLAPVYGEGAAGAFRRLMDEINKLEKCIRDMHTTDPRRDKKRIEDTKGGLLKDSYCWIINNVDYLRWRHGSQSQLLWITGDQDRGKTMLLCGIIDELQNSVAKTDVVSYFFCQAADSRINSAVAVLRGLLYLLVS